MLKIKTFTFNPFSENTYILYNELNNCIIIDPGCYFEAEKEAITQFIAKSGLKPVMLLNTHCHLDHVFGNKYIAEAYYLTLKIHIKEKPVFDDSATRGLMYNVPFDNYTGSIEYLKEGDIAFLNNDELKVIEAPGHSPGHICFYCAKQHFIIGGDVLFKGSVGRTDLPGGNHQALINNIKQKLLILPNETIVYSGHGEPTTIGEEKIENPYLK